MWVGKFRRELMEPFPDPPLSRSSWSYCSPVGHSSTLPRSLYCTRWVPVDPPPSRVLCLRQKTEGSVHRSVELQLETVYAINQLTYEGYHSSPVTLDRGWTGVPDTPESVRERGGPNHRTKTQDRRVILVDPSGGVRRGWRGQGMGGGLRLK